MRVGGRATCSRVKVKLRGGEVQQDAAHGEVQPRGDEGSGWVVQQGKMTGRCSQA